MDDHKRKLLQIDYYTPYTALTHSQIIRRKMNNNYKEKWRR